MAKQLKDKKHKSIEETLWDAYFPALLSLSSDLQRAKASDNTWDFLWDKHGLIPMVYD
jgi:hypothetical protein